MSTKPNASSAPAEAPSDPSVSPAIIRAAVDRTQVEVDSTPSKPPAAPFRSAASLLRSAARLFIDGGEQPDLDDVGELLGAATERLVAWTREIVDEDGSAAFDALDCCTAVATLIKAGNPCNAVTPSPIRGVLWLAVERLEQTEGEDPSTAAAALETAQEAPPAEIPEALARYLADLQARAMELQDLLGTIERDPERQDNGVLSIAERLAQGLNRALDTATLARVQS